MEKQEDLLVISLGITDEERRKSPELQAGFSDDGQRVELIVRYVGSIRQLIEKYPGTEITELLGGYGIIVTARRFVDDISAEENIEYVEKPKLLYPDIEAAKAASCITQVQQGVSNPYNLTGLGTIVAVIDSGINLKSSEFNGPDGKTRIIDIWDQTSNVIVSGDEVEEYISQQGPQRIAADTIGHGNNVTRIACGNNGVAPGAQIIVVKMGFSVNSSFPRTTQLMEAVDFCIRKGIAYNKPISINISYGNNYGDHTGTSLLETYINSVISMWKCAICVGSGNEGSTATHTSGQLTTGVEQLVELAVGPYETTINIQIWKDYTDDFDIEIITPSGESLGRIGKYNRINRATTRSTEIITYYGTPSPYSIRQEIYIDMVPISSYIQYGIWTLRIIPGKIVSGRFDMWLPAAASLNTGTGFTFPKETMTITIPSTAQSVITVGAYDARSFNVASFSGAGYVVRLGPAVTSKPDIAAPGVGIRLDEVTQVTGTSFATPFVTGSAALLMEWGIVRGNEAYLYGEKLKAYLIKGARRSEAYANYPNVYVGWGALCLRDSISV